MIGVSNSKPSVLFWSLAAVVAWALTLALYYLLPDAYIWLGTEDKFGENMTSVFYIGAGGLVLWRSLRLIAKKDSTPVREVFPLLIGIFYIFVGGEEISWGQRLFGFATPETFAEKNVQGETTLHNLGFFDRGGAVLNQHTALNLIALLMGVVAPLSYRFVSPLRRLITKLNFPSPPVAVTMWFVVGLLHGQTIAKLETHWAHTEVKELIFSVGFFLGAWSYFKNRNWD